MIVHAMALPPAPAAPLEAEAAVVGPKRTLPGVKHSQWVMDRSAVQIEESRFTCRQWRVGASPRVHQ